jgi:sulfoquinovosyltransferase
MQWFNIMHLSHTLFLLGATLLLLLLLCYCIRGCMVFPALICSRLLSRPIVLSYHTHLPVILQSYLPWLPTRWVWKYIRFIHSFADLTLVTSPQLEQEFHSHGIPRVQVWQKGIDSERFHPVHSCDKMRRRMAGGKPTDFLIVYVGRLATEKRVHDLEGILEHLPGARLCLVGAGPHEAPLKEVLPEAVFLGELQGEELSQAFASADVFLFPSDSETLGFVVMEAMASGLAVVAANAGGIPSMIRHRDTGWLVEPGNKTEYIRILQLLQANSAWRLQLAVRARKATEAWTWEASMANLRNMQYGQAILNYEDRRSVRMWRALFNRKNTGGLKTG